MKKAIIFLIIIFSMFILGFIRIPAKQVTFGFYAGECIDSCQVVYTVSEYKIKKSIWSYPSEIYDSENLIDQKKLEENEDGSFNKYKPWIPLLMLIIPSSTIGCPDCMDQGGIILDFEVMGISKRFNIDPLQSPFYFWNMNDKLTSLGKAIDKKLK